ncbi:MAG: DUF4173 domain-containing protein [Acetobacter sp.]|nr:DUF4173 domain-containing protein [Bacteroides sp.]MCM1341503.1 DUF4173 domain-containing protein [Acetobacter sp.]MCM1433709.1 DUF4173 domain-containing protein [Clostridiales bacterium]
MDSNVYFNPDELNKNNSVSVITNAQMKPVLKLGKRDLVFSFIFFAVSAVIVDFILLHGLNLGFSLAYVLLFIISSIYLYDKNNNTSAFSYICGVLSLAGSITFTLYHDYFVNAVMLVSVILLFTIYVCGLSGTFSHNEGSYKIVIDMLSGIFNKPFSNAGDIFSGLNQSVKKGSNFKNALIGAAVAIPVLLVIIPVLVSSDAAFESLVSLAMKNIGIYIVEFILAAAVACYLVLYFVSKKSVTGVSQGRKKTFSGVVPSVAGVSFLSVISVVYLVYLFSQLAYFFSAFSGILPNGYELTASGFARRGFFEMFAICIINIVIITGITILTKKSERKSKSLMIVSAFIMLFTVLLLVTAIAKMKMNIDIFGLSKNRIMVSVFMVMMFVAIVFYVIHIFAPKFNYMQSVVIICSAIFIALGFVNIDARIADYNIKAYNDGKIKNLDVEYIADLSDSAVPYLMELSESENETIKNSSRFWIYKNMKYTFLDEFISVEDFNKVKLKATTDFREYNLSRNKAEKLYIEFFKSLSKEEKEDLFALTGADSYEESVAEPIAYELDNASTSLMMDLYSGVLNEDTKFESHSGFNGDGETYYEIKLDREFFEKYKTTFETEWHKLPYTDKIIRLTENQIELPKTNNGYYYFCNRTPEYNDDGEYVSIDDKNINPNIFNVLNYTLAVYDTDYNRMYFYELDT